MDNRYRPRSPPGGRRYHDPRASTGFISTSFEPAYAPYPRSADPYSGPRHSSVYDPSSVKRYAYNDAYNPPVTRTEYPVSGYSRPRNNSAISAEGRRPVSMISSKAASPPRYSKPVISNVHRDGRRSPPSAPLSSREDSSRYLVPARSSGSDHHQRHYSATRADVDRLMPAARGTRRGEYHQTGGYNTSKGYAGARGVKDDDFSYTGPREQFARDYPIRPRPRESLPTRRERPVSVMEMPEHRPPPLSRRDMPPPPIPRSSDRLEPVRRTGYDDMLDRPSDLPSRRHSMRQAVVHQRDDGYSSARDELDRRPPRPRRERYEDDDMSRLKPSPRDKDAPSDREKDYRRERDRDFEQRERERERDRDRGRAYQKERERVMHDRERERDVEKDRPRPSERKHRSGEDEREPRGNDASPERSSAGKVAAAGIAGVATAGIANAVLKSKKGDEPSDSDERKERRRRHRRRERNDVEDPQEVESPVDRRPKEAVVPADDPTHRDSGYGTARPQESSEDPEEEHARRRRRRKSHREREDLDTPPDGARLAPPDANATDRDLSPGDDDGGHRRRREMSRTRDIDAPDREQNTMSPGEDEDGRPRRVQLVEPGDKRDDFKPKGILKPSRTTPFPEDPNPTREGVAPLKDAGKQGIPSTARWTKISRMLVNPEALEKSHERFEERDDYVIVLRVLTKDEITKFAEKTQEIRAERERSWNEQLEQQKTAAAHRQPEVESDDEEEDEPTPAIDSRAAEPGLDPQDLTAPTEPTSTAVPVPVPDIRLEGSETANYSTNV